MVGLPFLSGSTDGVNNSAPVLLGPLSRHRTRRPGRCQVIVLKPERGEAKRGRDHVAEIAADWPIDLDDVRVVTTELISNAIRHSGTREIRVDAYSDRDEHEGLYIVEVWDASHDPPVLCNSEFDSLGGRGLWIVEALTNDWGVYFDNDDGGKVVYAEWTK